MIIAVSIAVKALEVLLSNKKSRKFLGYVLGVALFIILLPVIVLFGLFGWMAGDADNMLDKNEWMQNLPIEQQQQLASIDDVCNNIEITFTEKGMTEADINKAESIYISKLMGLETQENFYSNFADCFLNVSKDKSVYTLVSETFLVAFSGEEIKQFDDMYGETP